jgi:dehydrodolichyl diphosphate syntase complex subunit NUS1
MHAIFSLYIRLRQVWHLLGYRISSVFFYHHRTPALIQRDVKRLAKKPRHLSVILTSEGGGRRGGDLERLINETADIAVWCACADIPVLSVYERSGMSF